MLKYVNTGVVFQEIPDETTLSINISGCPNHCPGCHSQYLWADIGKPLNEQSLQQLLAEVGGDVTCVCFMGGDNDPAEVERLAQWLHHNYPPYKVGWYSGKQYFPRIISRDSFDYFKLGPYLEHLGPLKSPTTNQRLYKKVADGEYVDITYRFWKQPNED
ncbi:MAG: anaerobic ribonucleoside-triphosphate reductase activating protein [Prevotella sp.]|nr:anaerobic ribonucleoside-triphosphate reductase activating protein [Prevotella sp.]